MAYGNFGSAEIDAQKGQPYGAIFGYAWKRYGAVETDANYLQAPWLLNANGQPSKSTSKTLLGNINPDFILGWNNSLTYKSFTLGFTLEWRKGGDVINDFNTFTTYSGQSKLTQERFYAATYQGANVVRTYTGVDATGKAATGNVQLTKTFYTTTFRSVDENYIEDATWLRLRNVYVNFSLPVKLAQKLHIKGADFGVAGRNLWLKTKYTGIDPEVSSSGSGPRGISGMEFNGIPATRSIDVSLKIKL